MRLSRRLSLLLHVVLWPTLIAVSLSRCGSDKDKKSGEEGAKPATGLVPSDWDGVSDYAASAFGVTEE